MKFGVGFGVVIWCLMACVIAISGQNYFAAAGWLVAFVNGLAALIFEDHAISQQTGEI